MNPIEWLSDEEFRVGGVKFLSGLRDYSLKTNDERIVILKDLPSLELYKTVFAGVEPRYVSVLSETRADHDLALRTIYNYHWFS